MRPQIRLLGKPGIDADDGSAPRRLRGHKAWGVLAFLLLNEPAPTRHRLASLLFADADDPLRAVRWNIAELRRGLGSEVTIGGDPVCLELSPGATVDVLEMLAGRWRPGGDLPGELLENFYFDSCPGFDAWLLVTRRRLSALVEAALVNSVRVAVTGRQLGVAMEHAGRLVELNPLDENHQTLLVRCFAESGDQPSAAKQLASATRLFRVELGVEPSRLLRDAARPGPSIDSAGPASVRAKIDAGRAAIAAGAIDAAVHCLRSAVVDAEAGDDRALLARALTSFGAALLRVGTSFADADPTLRRGLLLAEASGDTHSATVAHRELGFLHVQAGHRLEGDHHLGIATELAAGDDSELASIQAIQGMSLCDQARYGEAKALLYQSVERARRCDRHRKVAWSLAMLGRLQFICGESGSALEALDEARRICRLDRWSGFLPWPEVLGAEVELLLGHDHDALVALEHAHALARHLHDTGLQAFAARGLALAAERNGDARAAVEWIDAARLNAYRGSKTYVWIQAQVAETRSRLLIAHDPERAGDALDEWIELASHSGLTESTVRAHLAAAGMGRVGALLAATALAANIDNPVLHRDLAAHRELLSFDVA